MNWQWLLNDILKLFKWYSNERKAVGSGHVRKDRAHRFFVRVVFVLFETRRFCKVERFVFPDLHGSALRRGEVSYFSSLSKLFVIRKEENKKLNLWIEGQPKIHATFGNMKRPVALEVNGKVLPVDYEHEAVKVKAQK